MPFESPQADIPLGPPPDIYIWNAIQSFMSQNGGGSGGTSTNYSGTGSPEGVVTASVTSIYFDTSTDGVWYKKTGSGNTGWVQLIGP